ncbi:MAG: hypothetical protein A2068_02425 [Ignavibacteria bacterium GWB2_35_6b]|nr:MAG: hypothetical protein A2068_02425 [Ignavibacteria bacterium GWB2_35_6b]
MISKLIFIINLFYSGILLPQTVIKSNDDLQIHVSNFTETIIQISEYYYYNSQLNDADKILKPAIEITEQTGGKKYSAELLIQKAKINSINSFITNNSYEQSINDLNTAINYCKETNSTKLLGDAYNYLGFALYAQKYNQNLGTYEEALKYLNEAEQIRDEYKDLRGLAETYIYKGIVLERLGNNNEALELYSKANEICENNNFKLEQSYATRHIAFIKSYNKDFESALELFRKSLNLREEIGYKVYLPFSYLSVGNMYFELNRKNEAEEFYVKALTSALQNGAERVVVLCRMSLGDLYLSKNLYEKSLEEFTIALNISEKINFQRGINYSKEKINSLKKIQNQK